MIFDNKFGMFIHWGIYSCLGLHEQALARYDISHGEYERLASDFNPTEYDPAGWVRLAKEAGMKYICFTAKHHDGFCMWDTKETDYNVMNTPYGKDVLKMLSEACEKEGILLSIYYSNPDWHHPYGYNPASSHQWKAKFKNQTDTVKYREFVKRQVTELLTGYGRIYTFFWDIPPKICDPSMNELVRRLQPGIFINDRGYDDGDFSTPEREYEESDAGRFTRMTEACNSVGQQSWGYRKGENFYSKKHLCSAIDKYMAAGASYLLNVGPDSLGRIAPEYSNKIRRIGDFYNRVKGSLESTDGDSYDYGIKTNKYIATKKDNKTYLHFYEGLISDAVSLSRYPKKPRAVRLLNTGESLDHSITYLPESFAWDSESLKRRNLLISGIDIDSLSDEPIVIEIEW